VRDPTACLPGYRFPMIVIQEVVYLRFRFNLSLRDIPDLMARKGVELSHETVRTWCDKFGNKFAKQVRRRRPRPGDKWHLGEMVISINGVKHWLWRAVDQKGVALDILVTRSRDRFAAKRVLRRLLSKEQYVPTVMITDKLRSYGWAHQEVFPCVDHRSHKGLNNRAENSHQRTRLRQRATKRFKSAGHAQQFCSAHDHIHQHFRPYSHKMSATQYRETVRGRHDTWDEISTVFPGTAQTRRVDFDLAA
jgi:putative transposase